MLTSQLQSSIFMLRILSIFREGIQIAQSHGFNWIHYEKSCEFPFIRLSQGVFLPTAQPFLVFIYRSPLTRGGEDKENRKEVMLPTESPKPLSQRGVIIYAVGIPGMN